MVAILSVVVLAFFVENNQSRLGVRKSEYLRVLSNILESEGQNTPGDQASDKDQRRYGKKDSFFYLLSSLQARAQ